MTVVDEGREKKGKKESTVEDEVQFIQMPSLQ
jgi:hypothetical protein